MIGCANEYELLTPLEALGAYSTILLGLEVFLTYFCSG